LTQPELAAAVKVATTTRRAIERADIRLTHANAVTLRNAPRHQRGGVPRGLSARPRAHPAPPACNSLTAKTCHWACESGALIDSQAVVLESPASYNRAGSQRGQI